MSDTIRQEDLSGRDPHYQVAHQCLFPDIVLEIARRGATGPAHRFLDLEYDSEYTPRRRAQEKAC